MDCSACHTSKKITDQGPVLDNSLLLTGHIVDMPRIEIDRKEIEIMDLALPWEMYRHMTDEELKAVFAYLKSIKLISNVVPPPLPQVRSKNRHT